MTGAKTARGSVCAKAPGWTTAQKNSPVMSTATASTTMFIQRVPAGAGPPSMPGIANRPGSVPVNSGPSATGQRRALPAVRA